MLIGYARVSTQDQNLALQMNALQKECEKIYTEIACGVQINRPELMKLLDFMRDGDTLVVWKLDRLARSTKQLIETVESLEKKGIGFKSLNESIDTNTSSGRLIFHIFASLAEFERNIIRDRIIAGLAAAKRLGRLGGRPPSLKPDDIVAAKAMLRDGSITVEDVARRLNVSPSTLYRYFPGGRSALEEL